MKKTTAEALKVNQFTVEKLIVRGAKSDEAEVEARLIYFKFIIFL